MVNPQILSEVIDMTKKQAAIMEQYVTQMLELVDNGDNEMTHSNADDLLLDALRDLGFGQIADAWDEVAKMGFWYA
ncbi:hypothetical protein D3C81_772560 [compost metagenome]